MLHWWDTCTIIIDTDYNYIIVKLLYIHFKKSSSKEQTQPTNTLGCGEALKEMMHVLSHIDIYSQIK